MKLGAVYVTIFALSSLAATAGATPLKSCSEVFAQEIIQKTGFKKRSANGISILYRGYDIPWNEYRPGFVPKMEVDPVDAPELMGLTEVPIPYWFFTPAQSPQLPIEIAKRNGYAGFVFEIEIASSMVRKYGHFKKGAAGLDIPAYDAMTVLVSEIPDLTPFVRRVGLFLDSSGLPVKELKWYSLEEANQLRLQPFNLNPKR